MEVNKVHESYLKLVKCMDRIVSGETEAKKEALEIIAYMEQNKIFPEDSYDKFREYLSDVKEEILGGKISFYVPLMLND